MAQFDVQAARKQGYSDEQILNYLVQKQSTVGKKFDLEGALKEGHTPQELINYLSSFEAPEKLESNIPKWGRDNPLLWKVYSFGKEAVKPATEAGGSMIGAEIGSAGGPITMLIGGTLGYAITKKSLDMTDSYIKKIETGKMPPTTVKKEMLDSLKDLKDGATYEMIGQSTANMLPKAIEVVTAPFQKKMTPAARFVWDEAQKYGITLTPAEITGSKSAALAESLLEKIWGATDIIRDMRLKKQLVPLENELSRLLKEGGSQSSIEDIGMKIWNQVDDYLRYEKNLQGDLLNSVRTKLIAKYGSELPLSQLGLDAKEAIKVRTEILRGRKNALYQDIGKSMPEPFETLSLSDEAEKILNAKKDLPNYGLDKETVTWLKWAAKDVEIPPQLEQTLENVPAELRESILADIRQNAPIEHDWNTMQEFKRSMESIMRQDDPMRYTGLKGQMTEKGYIANRLKQAALSDMRNAVEATAEGIDAKIVGAYEKWMADNPGMSRAPISEIAERSGASKEEIHSFIENNDIVRSGVIEGPVRGTPIEKMAYKGSTMMRIEPEHLQALKSEIGKSSDALEKLKIADAFYGEYADVVKHKKIRDLIKADAGKVIDVAFKPNAIEEVQLLKKAAGADGFLSLREGFMNKLTGLDKQEVFNPEFFRNNLVKYGDETLNEIFGPNSAKELRKIAQEGLDLSKHNPPTAYYKSILKEDPDFIVDKIIGAPESKLQSNIMGRNLKRIREVVDEKTFNEIRDKFSEKFFQVNQTTDIIKPIAFAKTVDKYDRVLRKFYPYEKIEQLRSLRDIAKHLQKAEDVAGNPSGTGQTLISWGIFRMIMNLPGGTPATKVATGLITLGPKQLAKLYTSKFGLKWLTEGFKVPAASKRGIELGAKITAILQNEEND